MIYFLFTAVNVVSFRNFATEFYSYKNQIYYASM